MFIRVTVNNWKRAIHCPIQRQDVYSLDHYIQLDGFDCAIRVETSEAARQLEAAARSCAEAMEVEQATEHGAEKPIHDSDRDQRPDPKAAE